MLPRHYLVTRHVASIGIKLPADVGKHNLAALSDGWSIDTDGSLAQVYLHTNPKRKLELTDSIPLEKFNDWEIVNAASYEHAHIKSKQAKLKTPLHLFVPDDIIPIFDSAFNYPSDTHPDGIPPTGNFAHEQVQRAGSAASGASCASRISASPQYHKRSFSSPG